MHSDMLKKIHANHLGAESNIRMARDVLFWPGMRKAIHDMCNACQTCAQYGNTAPKKPMKSLPVPTRPWQLISQDIFSFQSQHYLVTVCHFSDWIEVDKLENLSSTTVVEKTKAHFSRFGIPEVCHTDNGPQFFCAEYENFSKTYAFQHIMSSPYHPAGNGRAEAAVKLVKTMMKKIEGLSCGYAALPKHSTEGTYVFTSTANVAQENQNNTPHCSWSIDTTIDLIQNRDTGHKCKTSRN